MRSKYIISIDPRVEDQYLSEEARRNLVDTISAGIFAPSSVIALPPGIILTEVLVPDLPLPRPATQQRQLPFEPHLPHHSE